VLQRVEFSAAAHAAKEAARVASGGSQAPRVFNIPTFVYNVVSNDGTERGFVSDAGLKLQIAEMNKAYATAVTPDGVEGTSAARAKITWNFSLVNITRIKAGDMCDSAVEKTVKAASRKGGRGALNLYITDLSACGLLGYSTWPWELEPKAGKPNALIMDGVVIHFETLPKGTYKPFNMGRTCIHETGHWMGLYHVFQNGGRGRRDGGGAELGPAAAMSGGGAAAGAAAGPRHIAGPIVLQLFAVGAKSVAAAPISQLPSATRRSS
jgi:hypothetical protein